MAKQVPAFSFTGLSSTAADNNYWYIFLKSSGTLTMAYTKKSVDIAIVGGGGSGSYYDTADGGIDGGGGGGGASINIVTGSLTQGVGNDAIIGAGGDGTEVGYTEKFTSGGYSSFAGLSANGGDGATTSHTVQEPGPGPKHGNHAAAGGAAGTYWVNGVNSGSTGKGGTGGANSGNPRPDGQAGGNGINIFGLGTYYGAGGGGGGGRPLGTYAGSGGAGGTTGGGSGANAVNFGWTTAPGNAAANTGSGGGGGGGGRSVIETDAPGRTYNGGGKGGSGIVIIRGTEEDLIPLTFNGVQFAKITFNSAEVASATFNGTKLFFKRIFWRMKELISRTKQKLMIGQGVVNYG